jgi:adenylate cyclase
MKTRIGLLAFNLFTVIILLFHLTGITPIRFLTELEYKAYDARLRVTLPGGVDPRIVIIDIDENSLANQGGWPWPREKIAKLTNTLFDKYKIEVLGFDVVFPEADDDLTLLKLQKIAKSQDVGVEVQNLLNETSGDEQFAHAIAGHNVVLGYGFDSNISSVSVGQLPDPVLKGLDTKLTKAPKANRYTANLPIFQEFATGGYFSLLTSVDTDGIIRRVPLLNRFDNQFYEAFSLAIARSYLGVDLDPMVLNTSEDATSNLSELIGLDLGFTQISIDNRSSVYVPYQGPSGSFRYIPAADVLNQTVTNPEDMEGVIALVGTSAAGLVDLRATPIQSVYPGVEIHANVIAGLLDGTFKAQPEWVRGGEFLLILALGLLLTFLLPLVSALWMTVFAFGSGILLTGINLYLWTESSFVLPLANTLVLVTMLYFFNMIYGFFSETKSRMELKSTFGMYIPPEIVDQMKGKTGSDLLVSERRDMTVLFADIRDFTPISEALDPKELTEFMNAFLTPLTETIHHHRGAIDKYMGDAIMAFWGAPLEDNNHSLHGVQAAVAMKQNVIELNKKFADLGWPQIRIGIGLSSGPVSVGNMGSEFRMAYTVLGDTVNIGSRLEGLTKNYGVEIITSDSTVNAISDYTFFELDYVQVKGKAQAIKIFEPLGPTSKLDITVIERCATMGEMLNCYRNKDWSKAATLLDKLSTLEHHPVYDIYSARIKQFAANPPQKDWNGVFVYDTK